MTEESLILSLCDTLQNIAVHLRQSSLSVMNNDYDPNLVYIYFSRLCTTFLDATTPENMEPNWVKIHNCSRLNNALLMYFKKIDSGLSIDEKDLIINGLAHFKMQIKELEATKESIKPFQFGADTVKKSQNLVSTAGARETQLFLNALKQVRFWLAAKGYVPKQIFFSYAHPLESQIKEEYWLIDYLKLLAQHLEAAGIIVVWDNKDSRFGASIQTHVNQINASDFVLLFGTPSLRAKYESKKPHMVKDEIMEVLYSLERDESKTIPILLSGSIEHSFPRIIPRNLAIEDWTKGNYVEHFKALVAYIYKLPSNSLYENLWLNVLKTADPISGLQYKTASKHFLFVHCDEKISELPEDKAMNATL